MQTRQPLALNRLLEGGVCEGATHDLLRKPKDVMTLEVIIAEYVMFDAPDPAGFEALEFCL
jgi:hypothetical protein